MIRLLLMFAALVAVCGFTMAADEVVAPAPCPTDGCPVVSDAVTVHVVGVVRRPVVRVAKAVVVRAPVRNTVKFIATRKPVRKAVKAVATRRPVRRAAAAVLRCPLRVRCRC